MPTCGPSPRSSFPTCTSTTSWICSRCATRSPTTPNRPPAPVPVWLPPGGAALLARAVAPFDECDAPGRFAATVRVAEYDPALPAAHRRRGRDLRARGPRSAGLGDRGCLDREARDLAYTGDTGPAADLAGFFAGAAVVVAEATLLEPGDRPFAERGSLTAAEAGALAHAAGAETLVLTHLWQEYGFEPQRAQAAAAFAGRIEVARPGVVVEW